MAAAEAGDLLFGTIDSWLIWHLTGGVRGGVHVTDATNASRTMLMGLESLAWEPSLLDAVGVPAAMLPEIRSSSEVYGEGVGDLAGVPIAGDLGDQHAALFGQACFEAGQAKCTYGTGCFLLMHTGERPVPSTHGLITTVAARLGDAPATYALEGSVAVAGALVGWLRDNLGHHQRRVRDRAAGAVGAGLRGRRVRARLFGAVRAALAERRPRRHRGADPVRDTRPHRARRARGDGLPGVRPRAGDGRGPRRGAPRRSARRRRHDRETSC